MPAITEPQLFDVAFVYLGAVAERKPPTKAVMDEFDRPHRTATYWVKRAREAGFLPAGAPRGWHARNPALEAVAAELGLEVEYLRDVIVRNGGSVRVTW